MPEMIEVKSLPRRNKEIDAITQYAIDKYITPARNRGDYVVGILSGDIHRALGKMNQLPQVCSKLGSNVFQREARVRRIALEGPTNGANALFVYRLK